MFKTTDTKGFTFLEILAAMIIMTVALIPIMQIMPATMKASRRVERLTQAGFLAGQKIEEARKTIFNPDYDFDSTDASESATAFAEPFAFYKYTVTDDQGSGIKELNVTTWFDENGNGLLDADEEKVSIDTKIADRG